MAQIQSISVKTKHTTMVCRSSVENSRDATQTLSFAQTNTGLWSHCIAGRIHDKSLQMELDKLQGLNCDGITGAIRICPSAATEALLDKLDA